MWQSKWSTWKIYKRRSNFNLICGTMCLSSYFDLTCGEKLWKIIMKFNKKIFVDKELISWVALIQF